MNQGESTTMIDEPIEGDLFPEARAKEGATGVPLVLADGQEWLLADGGMANALDGLRDRIDDAARLRGEVDTVEVRNAAFILLKANYDLVDGEAATLIMGAEPQALTDAVSLALFGDGDGRRTYSVWATASLLANGVDPGSVPVRFMPFVLEILVQTKRTVPAGQFIESAIAAKRFAAMRARVRPAAEPAEANPPSPPIEATS